LDAKYLVGFLSRRLVLARNSEMAGQLDVVKLLNELLELLLSRRRFNGRKTG
jgi:hypothetical protein